MGRNIRDQLEASEEDVEGSAGPQGPPPEVELVYRSSSTDDYALRYRLATVVGVADAMIVITSPVTPSGDVPYQYSARFCFLRPSGRSDMEALARLCAAASDTTRPLSRFGIHVVRVTVAGQPAIELASPVVLPEPGMVTRHKYFFGTRNPLTYVIAELLDVAVADTVTNNGPRVMGLYLIKGAKLFLCVCYNAASSALAPPRRSAPLSSTYPFLFPPCGICSVAHYRDETPCEAIGGTPRPCGLCKVDHIYSPLRAQRCADVLMQGGNVHGLYCERCREYAFKDASRFIACRHCGAHQAQIGAITLAHDRSVRYLNSELGGFGLMETAGLEMAGRVRIVKKLPFDPEVEEEVHEASGVGQTTRSYRRSLGSLENMTDPAERNTRDLLNLIESEKSVPPAEGRTLVILSELHEWVEEGLLRKETFEELGHIFHFYVHGAAGRAFHRPSHVTPHLLQAVAPVPRQPTSLVLTDEPYVPRPVLAIHFFTNMRGLGIPMNADNVVNEWASRVLETRRGPAFEFVLEGDAWSGERRDPIRGVLYYCPTLSTVGETVPLDRDRDEVEHPVAEVFFQGRLVPKARVMGQQLPFFPRKSESSRVLVPEPCYGRVRGFLFLGDDERHTFGIEPTKLDLKSGWLGRLHSLRESGANSYSIENTYADSYTALAGCLPAGWNAIASPGEREFLEWLRLVHAEFDEEVRFSNRFDHTSGTHHTDYGAAEFEGKAFVTDTMVHFAIDGSSHCASGVIECFRVFGRRDQAWAGGFGSGCVRLRTATGLAEYPIHLLRNAHVLNDLQLRAFQAGGLELHVDPIGTGAFYEYHRLTDIFHQPRPQQIYRLRLVGANAAAPAEVVCVLYHANSQRQVRPQLTPVSDEPGTWTCVLELAATGSYFITAVASSQTAYCPAYRSIAVEAGTPTVYSFAEEVAIKQIQLGSPHSLPQTLFWDAYGNDVVVAPRDLYLWVETLYADPASVLQVALSRCLPRAVVLSGTLPQTAGKHPVTVRLAGMFRRTSRYPRVVLSSDFTSDSVTIQAGEEVDVVRDDLVAGEQRLCCKLDGQLVYVPASLCQRYENAWSSLTPRANVNRLVVEDVVPGVPTFVTVAPDPLFFAGMERRVTLPSGSHMPFMNCYILDRWKNHIASTPDMTVIAKCEQFKGVQQRNLTPKGPGYTVPIASFLVSAPYSVESSLELTVYQQGIPRFSVSKPFFISQHVPHHIELEGPGVRGYTVEAQRGTMISNVRLVVRSEDNHVLDRWEGTIMVQGWAQPLAIDNVKCTLLSIPAGMDIGPFPKVVQAAIVCGPNGALRQMDFTLTIVVSEHGVPTPGLRCNMYAVLPSTRVVAGDVRHVVFERPTVLWQSYNIMVGRCPLVFANLTRESDAAKLRFMKEANVEEHLEKQVEVVRFTVPPNMRVLPDVDGVAELRLVVVQGAQEIKINRSKTDLIFVQPGGPTAGNLGVVSAALAHASLSGSPPGPYQMAELLKMKAREGGMDPSMAAGFWAEQAPEGWDQPTTAWDTPASEVGRRERKRKTDGDRLTTESTGCYAGPLDQKKYPRLFKLCPICNITHFAHAQPCEVSSSAYHRKCEVCGVKHRWRAGKGRKDGGRRCINVIRQDNQVVGIFCTTCNKLAWKDPTTKGPLCCISCGRIESNGKLRSSPGSEGGVMTRKRKHQEMEGRAPMGVPGVAQADALQLMGLLATGSQGFASQTGSVEGEDNEEEDGEDRGSDEDGSDDSADDAPAGPPPGPPPTWTILSDSDLVVFDRAHEASTFERLRRMIAGMAGQGQEGADLIDELHTMTVGRPYYGKIVRSQPPGFWVHVGAGPSSTEAGVRIEAWTSAGIYTVPTLPGHQRVWCFLVQFDGPAGSTPALAPPPAMPSAESVMMVPEGMDTGTGLVQVVVASDERAAETERVPCLVVYMAEHLSEEEARQALARAAAAANSLPSLYPGAFPPCPSCGVNHYHASLCFPSARASSCVACGVTHSYWDPSLGTKPRNVRTCEKSYHLGDAMIARYNFREHRLEFEPPADATWGERSGFAGPGGGYTGLRGPAEFVALGRRLHQSGETLTLALLQMTPTHPHSPDVIIKVVNECNPDRADVWVTEDEKIEYCAHVVSEDDLCGLLVAFSPSENLGADDWRRFVRWVMTPTRHSRAIPDQTKKNERPAWIDDCRTLRSSALLNQLQLVNARDFRAKLFDRMTRINRRRVSTLVEAATAQDVRAMDVEAPSPPDVVDEGDFDPLLDVGFEDALDMPLNYGAAATDDDTARVAAMTLMGMTPAMGVDPELHPAKRARR